MGAAWSAIKILIVPAIISLVLFLFVTFALLPLWYRYRNRYSQYLPLDSLGYSQAASLRDRIANRLASLTLPSTWRQDMGRFAAAGAGADSSPGASVDDLEGEELNDIEARLDTGPVVFSSDTVRLSRDLEQGFIDDSDNSDD